MASGPCAPEWSSYTLGGVIFLYRMPFCICMRVAGIVGTATGSTGLSVTPVFLLLLSKGTAFSTPSGVLGWFRRIETDALFDAPCVVYGKFCGLGRVCPPQE